MRLFAAAPIALLTACAPETGIWLLEIEASTDSTCESALTHNFVNVIEPAEEEDDPNWSEESTASVSPTLRFVKVEMGGGTNCVLLWGNEVFPGTCDGSNWSFKWDLREEGDTLQNHALGYTYSHVYEYVESTELTLNVSGTTGSGSLSEGSSRKDVYSESDMWAQAVGQAMGQMPAGTFLRKMGQDSEGNPIVSPATNTRADTECAASECSIDYTETCTAESRTVVATHYAFGDDPSYDDVRGSIQNPGVPTPQPSGNGGNGGGGNGGGEAGGGEN